MRSNNVWYGTVYSYDQSNIVISDGYHGGVYQGNNFTYQNGQLVGGTLTGYLAAINVQLNPLRYTAQYSATGFNLDARTAYQYIQSGNASGFSSWALSGNDSIYGSASNDYLIGYGGNDTIDGGSGIDHVVYLNNRVAYGISYSTGQFTVSGPDGTDLIKNVEYLNFGDWELIVPGSDFDPLQYIASYSDLINAFHANSSAGMIHYMDNGYNEGRVITFDALNYIASYGDLINAFHTDTESANSHYINNGFNEGRNAHFNASSYLALNSDLQNAFGNDQNSATIHYIHFSFSEKRDTVIDSLKYIATYKDLINAFHTDTASATNHYINNGFDEGRSASFDANTYLALYTDLRVAFGSDLRAATIHYINHGSLEGRHWINEGSDILTGGISNDTLTGGLGNDIFIFNTTANSLTNVDTITDFVSGADHLQFSKAVFTGLGISNGNLNIDQFYAGSSASTAHDATDRIIYNSKTGELFYDADGLGGYAAVQVAIIGTITHPELGYSDVQIVA